MLVTVQFQLVVAACNAALTFPVLLVVGIPNAPSLALMIFVSGMVPVVGNFVSGAILMLLAYQAKGWAGLIGFAVLTFVLHKLESYYLNPRLAARHVRLPGFVLIVSLILFEHLLGFVGLFLSFPFLFVAKRLRDDLRAESPGLTPAEPARLAAAGSDGATHHDR
jgi:predicted PurR-regulated permease PerM